MISESATLEYSNLSTPVTIYEIFRQRQTALGLSDWEVAKRVSMNRGGDTNRFASAALKAIKNLEDAGKEKVKYPMLKDLFLALDVDIETAIAIAASAAPKS